jgi:hypothetical protein
MTRWWLVPFSCRTGHIFFRRKKATLLGGAGWRWASAQLLMLQLTLAGTIELGKHAPGLSQGNRAKRLVTSR